MCVCYSGDITTTVYGWTKDYAVCVCVWERDNGWYFIDWSMWIFSFSVWKYKFCHVLNDRINWRVACLIIEAPMNIDGESSHQFMWIFPVPLYKNYGTLCEINQTFVDKLGLHLYIIHSWSDVSVCVCVCNNARQLISTIRAVWWDYCILVNEKDIKHRVFLIADTPTEFKDYYDNIQEFPVAGYDEMLPGKSTYIECYYSELCI